MSFLHLPNLIAVLLGLPAAVVIVHTAIYLVDPYGIRKYPGPFLAKFSDVWLGWVSQQGHRSEVIHEMHKEYGPFMRISPSEVSISDPDALGIVYAHGNGTLKSSFYDAFVSIERGLMNTRDRKQRTRKRKIVAYVFSQKSIVEFEPHVAMHVRLLLEQWDRLYDYAVKGLSGDEANGWVGRGGRLWLDCLPWTNFLALDIIGDLAFGASFGMITAAKDVAPVPVPDALSDVNFSKPDVVHIPAVAVLNGRGEYSMSTGVLPGWWRPLVSRLPWYRAGFQNVRELAGIAIVAVEKRLATPTDRVDLLSKLQAGTDDNGDPMGRSELMRRRSRCSSPGRTRPQSGSACAIIYHLAANPEVQARLQKELDAQLGTEDEMVAMSEQVKHLPYLEACINEALRIHSTSALGLPRVVPEGGLIICDHLFPAGSVVSVPSYTIHRDPGVWGHDVDVYRPERWFEADKAAGMQKTFNPFSVGPRACVGRNLASLELQIIVASILRRFHFVLEQPEEPLETREGFLRKPLRCDVGIKRRDV
ncbi:cytochrome P450 monooxygenase [Mycena rosella]|uniref:Cytochrome P450 monooxygenase n=1 Tax=Mycena rosella TaxID=1033263 RepID=A0AAD7CU62_MYCRO|nr:cytochrome P450 monooxygenase [Mycena rosella]